MKTERGKEIHLFMLQKCYLCQNAVGDQGAAVNSWIVSAFVAS